MSTSEELCPTCVHQGDTFATRSGMDINNLRFNPDSPDDMESLKRLGDRSEIGRDLGQEILNAVQLPRPERCKRLQELLPYKSRRIKGTDKCPELGIWNVILDENKFAKGGYDL